MKRTTRASWTRQPRTDLDYLKAPGNNHNIAYSLYCCQSGFHMWTNGIKEDLECIPTPVQPSRAVNWWTCKIKVLHGVFWGFGLKYPQDRGNDMRYLEDYNIIAIYRPKYTMLQSNIVTAQFWEFMGFFFLGLWHLLCTLATPLESWSISSSK